LLFLLSTTGTGEPSVTLAAGADTADDGDTAEADPDNELLLKSPDGAALPAPTAEEGRVPDIADEALDKVEGAVSTTFIS